MTCLVCRRELDWSDLGLTLTVHVFQGWPELHAPPSRVDAHHGKCTQRLLDHLVVLEREGLPSENT